MERSSNDGTPAGAPRRTAAFLLGVPIDDVTMEETVEHVVQLVEHGRRSGSTHQIATVNVDFLVNALHDPTLARLMRRTSLSIPDGMPVVWGARALGSPLRARVAGADLLAALAERIAGTDISLALFGGAPGVAQQAAALLADRYPGVRVQAIDAPKFGDISELSFADLTPLAEAAPDICCVAFGNPKQEHFIARFGADLGIPVLIGVGGTFDFLVGVKRRAPAWMQRSGLEWLHRAGTEPRRLAKRYVRDATVFLPGFLRRAWSGRRSGRDGRVTCTNVDGQRLVIDLTALRRANHRIASEVASALRSTIGTGATIEVLGARAGQLSDVPGLDDLLISVGSTLVDEDGPAKPIG